MPRQQRRATLPPAGCKICGCKGCNPIDIRKDKRQELKNNLQKEGKLISKRQRLLDSDDEDLEMNTRFDDWNKARKEFGQMIQNYSKIDMLIMGIGIPLRHPSYILGRPYNENNQTKDAMSVASGSIGANAGNSYAENSLDELSQA